VKFDQSAFQQAHDDLQPTYQNSGTSSSHQEPPRGGFKSNLKRPSTASANQQQQSLKEQFAMQQNHFLGTQQKSQAEMLTYQQLP
jgi:hypothetical protein